MPVVSNQLSASSKCFHCMLAQLFWFLISEPRSLLADRMAYFVQCCVCRLSVVCTECIVAKWCVLKQVTIDNLQEVVRSMRNWLIPEWMILTFVFRGRFKVMSAMALHSTLNISRKPLEIGAWFKETTNRKWLSGKSNGHVTDDVTRPRKIKPVTPIGLHLDRNISKTTAWRCYMATLLITYLLWGNTLGSPSE